MIEIIPAIDIIDGKCVRLSQGDYDSKKVYNENPVEVAKEFEANGVRRLHVVDLDGAASHHVVNYRVLERIAVHTSLVIDFGGGVKSDEDLKIAFESGAQMVTGGSIAVKDPELFCHWLEAARENRLMPTPAVAILRTYSSLAQSVEHAAVNRRVVRSSRTGGAKALSAITLGAFTFFSQCAKMIHVERRVRR